jgi:hypothetical protein
MGTSAAFIRMIDDYSEVKLAVLRLVKEFTLK